MNLESEEYILDYQFELLPDTHDNISVEIDWPGIEGGGVTLYENDGRGTFYCWIVTESLINIAKERLHATYMEVSEKREVINKLIVQQYGSMRVFDAMKYAIYRNRWAATLGSGAPPTSGLIFAAWCTRTSPLTSQILLELGSTININGPPSHSISQGD